MAAPTSSTSNRTLKTIQDGYDPAKYLAMIAMIVNHVLIVQSASLAQIGYAIGRPSLPIFATVLTLRIAGRPHAATRAAIRLFFWSAVAQPFYAMAFSQPGQANILTTLAIGAWLCSSIDRKAWTEAGLLTIAAAIASPYVDSSALPALAMPLAATLTSSPGGRTAIIATAAAFADLTINPFAPAAALIAFLAIPAIIQSPTLKFSIPRMPRHAFYAFYPLHLALIAAFQSH
jgi:hypothetical protein